MSCVPPCSARRSVRWRRVTRAGLGVLLLSSLLVPSVYANDRVEARKYFQAGMALIQARQYDEGIALLGKAYQLAPHPSVLYNIGRAYLDAGRLDEALSYLKQYVEADPPDRAEVEVLVNSLQEKQEQARLQALEQARAARAPARADGVASEELTAVATQLKTLSVELERLIAAGAVARPNPNPAGQGAGGEILNEAGVSETSQPGESSPEEAGAERAPGNLADPYAPVVVSASRFSQSPLEAPNALTIITGDELRELGGHSIGEVLRQVPGLAVMAISPSDYNFSIRGFGSPLANKVLVLVDGRSFYLDFIGANLLPLLSISPSDIERIEIIRGPGAALYGANAFSGVINIITRSPGESEKGSSVTLRGGLPDFTSGDLHLNGKQGKVAYRASVGFERVERWALEVDPDRQDYETLVADPELSNKVNRFDIRLDQKVPGLGFLSLSGGMASGQVEFQAIGALRDFSVDGSYGYLRGDLVLPYNLTLQAFWNHVDLKAAPWAAPVGTLDLRSNPKSDIVDVELQWAGEQEFLVTHRLNAGIGFRNKAVSWEWLREEASEPHFSVFVQDEARLTDDLLGTFSLRYDRHPVLARLEEGSWIDRNPVSPRAAVVWRMAPTRSLRSSLGTAFRTPTFLETYINQYIPTSLDGVVVLNEGNEQLRSERILSLEVGYLEQAADGAYELEATAFANGVSSLIGLGDVQPLQTSVQPPETGEYVAGSTGFINLDEQFLSLGGELAGRIYPATGLEVYGSYSLNYVIRAPDENGETSVSVPDELLESLGCNVELFDCSTAPHRLSLGARYRLPFGVKVGADLHLTARQVWGLRSYDDSGAVAYDYVPLPAYQWLGIRVDYRSEDGRLEVGLRSSNLLTALIPVSEEEGAVITPEGTHREYPLGQPIPALVSGFMTWRF